MVTLRFVDLEPAGDYFLDLKAAYQVNELRRLAD